MKQLERISTRVEAKIALIEKIIEGIS